MITLFSDMYATATFPVVFVFGYCAVKFPIIYFVIIIRIIRIVIVIILYVLYLIRLGLGVRMSWKPY